MKFFYCQQVPRNSAAKDEIFTSPAGAAGNRRPPLICLDGAYTST
ncbi:hypothetical protein [Kineosporia sp. NBRC 101731]|nr:hypothetical protein [Kineosporia sp. NBRC 101731]